MLRPYNPSVFDLQTLDAVALDFESLYGFLRKKLIQVQFLLDQALFEEVGVEGF